MTTLLMIAFGLVFACYALVVVTTKRINFLLWSAGTALFIRYTIVSVIKDIVARPRPDVLFGGYSFPSGHATFFFALATAVYIRDRRYGALLFAMAALVSVARIAEGAHYFSDILFGAAIGMGVTYIIHKFFVH